MSRSHPMDAMQKIPITSMAQLSPSGPESAETMPQPLRSTIQRCSLDTRPPFRCPGAGFLEQDTVSVLSPVYGLGIDRVVQFTLVTPDGILRKANACQNIDLFWALRGGDGGTFGVVFNATHRVEPVLAVAVADMKLPSNI